MLSQAKPYFDSIGSKVPPVVVTETIGLESLHVIVTAVTFFPSLDSSLRSFTFVTPLYSAKAFCNLVAPAVSDPPETLTVESIVIVYDDSVNSDAADEYAAVASVHNPTKHLNILCVS